MTRLTGRLEVDGADVARYVWVDMFAASQNLLAGVFRDEAVTKASDPAGYLARKEDTDRLFDGALEAVGEIFFYASPLLDECDAPNHPWLSPEQKGSQPSRRKGPAAITRAWCLFELVTALAKEHKLHVALSPADQSQFEAVLTNDFDSIA